MEKLMFAVVAVIIKIRYRLKVRVATEIRIREFGMKGKLLHVPSPFLDSINKAQCLLSFVAELRNWGWEGLR